MALENEVEMKYVCNLLSWRAGFGDHFQDGDEGCLISPMKYGENAVLLEAQRLAAPAPLPWHYQDLNLKYEK